MGVVNVTPDSFYDGGRYDAPNAALVHALRLVDQGADVIDVGGESSRPGAGPVAEQHEIGRVIPVIEKLRARCDIPISIDTRRSGVAETALNAGATWINDISSGRSDPRMAHVAAERGCPVVLMHSRENPETMQRNPRYEDVVAEVKLELVRCIEAFSAAGVPRANMILDPGIGFAKRLEDNLALLRNIGAIARLGCPVLVGTSRKSFVGRITGREPQDRLHGTLGSVAAAFMHGARIFRVHDVAATRDCLSVLAAIESA